MRTPKCAACGGGMKKNGTTSAGRTRWRCRNPECGSSLSREYDTRARDLRCGLDWLFSKQSQAEHVLPARTLRRRCELMWSLWPPVPLIDEIHHVVHVDGIHLRRDAVVLIAVADGHVIGWHIARSERSAAWECLMGRIAPPDVLVCDGGGGVLKAARAMWPDTRIQRCLFHVQANITEPTGTRPRLEAGRRLRRIAVALARVRDGDDAAQWLASYNQWEQDFRTFLDEKSRYADGSVEDAHRRLAGARRMIRRRIREDRLFTFLDAGLAAGGPVPSTNNLIESWNGRLRDMLRRHRGLRLLRRLKAICWWCHQHTEHPETDAWLVANAITDRQLEDLYRHAWEQGPQGLYETFGIPMRYGTGIDWNDFHARVQWRSND